MPNVIEERIRRWKNKLIDLSKRNRLLNFKPTKVTTIRITDEIPSEIFKAIAIEEKTMKFLPFGTAQPREDGDSAQEDLFRTEESKTLKTTEILPEEFKHYDKDSLAEKHKDEFLQTNLEKKQLEKNLFRIYSAANSVMEEQGYNALFLAVGYLEWYESDASDVKLLAPVILIPVELERKSIKSDFVLSYTEESPIINPALIQKLVVDYGIKINELGDDYEQVESQEIFQEIQNKIKKLKRWRIINDIYLGLFSFDRFIMYKDLETNTEDLLKHKLIQTICQGGAHENVQVDVLCPPDEIEKDTQPIKTFQVLDADSSQQRAVLIVKKGHSIIIEGPPGTGKSQTIANIIAESLASGKKVLFVSQKMAALEVVKSRLEYCGLGDFCLELHSRNTNKKIVINELGRIMNLRKKPDHAHDDELINLEKLREELRSYAKELHLPFGELGMTPYQVFGIINSHPEIGDFAFIFPGPENWNKDKSIFCSDLMDRLGRNLENVGDPNSHPWKGARLTELPYSRKLEILENSNTLLDSLAQLAKDFKELGTLCSYTEVSSINDIEFLLDASQILLESPNSSADILTNNRWDSLSLEVNDLIQTVRKFNEIHPKITELYSEKILNEDVASLLQRYLKYSKSPIFIFFSSFWQDKKILKSFFKTRRRINLEEIVEDLKLINEDKDTALKIDNFDKTGRELFGEIWKRRETNWTELDKFSKWVVRFRSHVIQKHFKENIFSERRYVTDAQKIATLRNNVSSCLDKCKALLKSFVEMTALNEVLAFKVEIKEAKIEEVKAKITIMRDSIEGVSPWLSFQKELQECEKVGLERFVKKIIATKTPHNKIKDVFICQFLRCWVDVAITKRPALTHFNGKNHEQLIDKFKELDLRQMELAKIRIQHLLSGNFDSSWESSKSSEPGILERETRKSRAFKPLRKLFQEIPHLLLNLKPCLMMSPLTVAQYMSPSLFKFDLVIFDEASQVPPEDSIGAILRGASVVVAGDTQQLPPTTFFQSTVITPEDEEEEFEEYLPQDLDSILDESATAGFPRVMLEWHYRSRHESLIAFSNKNFYGNRLYTFPNAEETSSTLGVKFHLLPNTSYKKGQGVNIEEAQEVAKQVFSHFKENPEHSLGVGTFNLKQKFVIEDAIEQLRKENPDFEEFFAKDKKEHFFIKNLESIQGDERDVIFLSIGYGKDESGRLSMNFGPINRIGGEKRLNVLITRARIRLEIFSSIRGSDFDLSKTDSKGVFLLKSYLDFAEKGKAVLLEDSKMCGVESFSESPFEESVYAALVKQNLNVHKQVGCSGYRIDMAIVDSQHPGRYMLGIECDGKNYHSSLTARDRDRLRQHVLEDIGWTIYRIWSTDWFRNPKGELEKLLGVIKSVQENNFKKKLQNSEDSAIRFKTEDSEHKSFVSSAPESYSLTPIEFLFPQLNFYEGNWSKICKVLLRIVDHESPVHQEEAWRRVVQHWGMNTLGRKICSILEDIENRCLRDKKIIKKGDFYWSNRMEKPKVRLRSEADLNRDIKYIPPEEICEAAKLVLKKEFSMPMEALVNQSARLFGYERVSSEIYAYVENSINICLKNKEIIKNEEKLLLAK